MTEMQENELVQTLKNIDKSLATIAQATKTLADRATLPDGRLPKP